MCLFTTLTLTPFIIFASHKALFFLPYIALISAFAAQMALLGFYFFPLFLSLPEHVTLWLRIIPVHVRERGKKKEEEEKSPEKNHFAVTGI